MLVGSLCWRTCRDRRSDMIRGYLLKAAHSKGFSTTRRTLIVCKAICNCTAQTYHFCSKQSLSGMANKTSDPVRTSPQDMDCRMNFDQLILIQVGTEHTEFDPVHDSLHHRECRCPQHRHLQFLCHTKPPETSNQFRHSALSPPQIRASQLVQRKMIQGSSGPSLYTHVCPHFLTR